MSKSFIWSLTVVREENSKHKGEALGTHCEQSVKKLRTAKSASFERLQSDTPHIRRITAARLQRTN